MMLRELTREEHAALIWRHQHAIRLLNAKDDDTPGWELLEAVVAPGPELLVASLAAVRTERELAA